MISIAILKSDSIIANNNGVVIVAGKTQIELSWAVIAELADVSEPYFQEEMLKAFSLLGRQGNLN